MVWIKFLICAVVIFFAGKRVAKYADAISEKTALSGLWVGFILVSIATSLPELFTGVGSVMIDAPNLTMGNIFGANTYNLMNIGILDILHRGGPILGAVSSGQLLTAVFNIFIAGLAVLGIWLAGSRFFEASVFGVGVFSVAIFACYVISARMIFNFERRACLPARQEFPRIYKNITTSRSQRHGFVFAQPPR